MGQRKFNPETVSNSHRYNLQTSISNLFLFAFTLVEMAIFCRKKIKKTALLFAVHEKASVSEAF